MGDLLQAAVGEPGLILEAYSRFHGYSLGNRLAALVQCHMRGLEPGPIHTYQGWRQLGRQVRNGEKALWLCMPLTRKTGDKGQGKTRPNDSEIETSDAKSGEVISAFVWKPHWFFYTQTDSLNGESCEPETPLPCPTCWNKAQALEKLGIAEIPFDLMDGNCQGYAKERSVAVYRIAALPLKTLFHEMAHVVLGHTAEGECVDGEELPDPQPRHIRKAEAEATALLLLASLGLPGQEYCRGYIQSWLNGEGLGESSARRIFLRMLPTTNATKVKLVSTFRSPRRKNRFRRRVVAES